MIDRYQFLAEVINNDEEYFDFGEQEICRQFGCGKKLTMEEKLYGSKCVACGGENVATIKTGLNRFLPGSPDAGLQMKVSVNKS